MKKETLCWDCKNSYANKCCWFTNFTPVKDWNAEETEIFCMYKEKLRKTKSYLVKECPNFERDKRLTDIEKAKQLGISLRTYYRIKNLGKLENVSRET